MQASGSAKQPVVLYDDAVSRSGQVPLQWLEGWKGYLMTDGYAGYNAVARIEGVEQRACWAHARRKFVEAASLPPKGKLCRADHAIEQIAKRYRIERALKKVSADVRLQTRQLNSWPLLQGLRDWLDNTLPIVAPKTALGSALAYLDHHWSKLICYTERGDLPIDNNRCENAIRPFVVGRESWLFSDTQADARASAVIYR